ncbi:MAG TPA: fumarylacetoacetate hydrolase family protein [Burkholderiaceae bacterium]|jgi:fumarylpyruvate hydrolase|nr:fumarylacetoacetate hydrolase family protein [Burkholderiaceae bacterium]
MSYVLEPPAVPSVAVHGRADARFAVRRIYCVGRNYVQHAQEMGFSGREPPFFFLKPADALLPVGAGEVGVMHYPSLTHDLQHEVELVVAIGEGGRDIEARDALSHIFGYGVGLDMTRRDLQGEAKKQGRPWCIGKGFEESAPIGELRPAADCRLDADTEIRLDVNGRTRQRGTLGELIWSVPEVIEHLSRAWTLAPGDLIYTGTPAGVAAVVSGDLLTASVAGVGRLELRLA